MSVGTWLASPSHTPRSSPRLRRTQSFTEESVSHSVAQVAPLPPRPLSVYQVTQLPWGLGIALIAPSLPLSHLSWAPVPAPVPSRPVPSLRLQPGARHQAACAGWLVQWHLFPHRRAPILRQSRNKSSTSFLPPFPFPSLSSPLPVPPFVASPRRSRPCSCASFCRHL